MSVPDVLPDPEAAATTLLAAVTSGLSLAREPRLLRARFEEELRTLVQARSVAVREYPSDPSLQPAVVSFDVPGTPWATPAWLEATFEPAQPVDDWQRRTLSVAAHVASLLVQIEYANGRWGRPRRADGAAPLIGSSLAIRLVRDRIERVAATDFTVLIEGGSGPQPHPGFIEGCGQAAVHDGDGAVAGAGQDPVRLEFRRRAVTKVAQPRLLPFWFADRLRRASLPAERYPVAAHVASLLVQPEHASALARAPANERFNGSKLS